LYYRVLKEHRFSEGKRKPGQLVNIDLRSEADPLLAAGVICERKFGHRRALKRVPPAPRMAHTKRIVIWAYHSPFYSGGRVLMYQYGLALAQAGAEVWLATNAGPIWVDDYPKCPRLHVAIINRDPLPEDIDLHVAHHPSLGRGAMAAFRHKKDVPLICWSFETKNMVEPYVPAMAVRMGDKRLEFLKKADRFLTCSEDAKKYLLKYVGRNDSADVIYPAVNLHALERAKRKCKTCGGSNRPFAVWVGRRTAHKNIKLAAECVQDLDIPFDFIALSNTKQKMPPASKKHRFNEIRRADDYAKFGKLMDAHLTLMPSEFEAFGMVLAESLASGTPALVYDLPALREAFGSRLIYVRRGDERAYRKKAVELMKAPKPDMTKEAEWAKATYGPERMRQAIETVPYHAMATKKVTAQMILYWGLVPETLEAVYKYVDQIVVAYGPTVLNKAAKPDGSLEVLESFPDPDGKILIEKRPSWPDKRAMRNWCAKHTYGNYNLLLDADEIWIGLKKWIERGFDFGTPRWINLWHGGKHWIFDGRWGEKLAPYGSVNMMYRWSWWRPSYKYRWHHTPVDASGGILHDAGLNKRTAEECPDTMVYHLGHALPAGTMKAKHDFYLKRDVKKAVLEARARAWRDWKGEIGPVDDGIVAEVNWKLPAIVKRALKRLKDES